MQWLLADPTSELTGSLSGAQWKLFVNLKHFFNHIAAGKKSPETAAPPPGFLKR
jgi:hypothetical protein